MSVTLSLVVACSRVGVVQQRRRTFEWVFCPPLGGVCQLLDGDAQTLKVTSHTDAMCSLLKVADSLRVRKQSVTAACAKWQRPKQRPDKPPFTVKLSDDPAISSDCSPAAELRSGGTYVLVLSCRLLIACMTPLDDTVVREGVGFVESR